jgi:hypothetical protein
MSMYCSMSGVGDVIRFDCYRCRQGNIDVSSDSAATAAATAAANAAAAIVVIPIAVTPRW